MEKIVRVRFTGTTLGLKKYVTVNRFTRQEVTALLVLGERTINLVSFRVDEQTPSGKNEFISSGAESSSY